MKRVFKVVGLCLCCSYEVVMHSMGVPHVEGVSSQAANLLVTMSD